MLAIKSTRLESFYRDYLIQHLRQDGCDYPTIFKALCLLARGGDHVARSAVYKDFESAPCIDYLEHLVEMDGTDGLIRGIRVISKEELENDDWIIGSIVTSLGHGEYGSDEVKKIEKALSEFNILRQFVKQTDANSKKIPRPPRIRDIATESQFDELLAKPPSAKIVLGFSRNIARRMTDEMVEYASNIFPSVTDRRKLHFLVRIFAVRKFVGDWNALWKYLSDSNVQISWATALALGMIDDPQLRLRLQSAHRHGKKSRIVIKAIKSSLIENDIPWLQQVLLKTTNPDDIESIGMVVQSFIEDHPEFDTVGLATTFYELGPCDFCRSHIVKLLFERNQLPDYIQKEARFDCYSTTRELFK